MFNPKTQVHKTPLFDSTKMNNNNNNNTIFFYKKPIFSSKKSNFKKKNVNKNQKKKLVMASELIGARLAAATCVPEHPKKVVICIIGPSISQVCIFNFEKKMECHRTNCVSLAGFGFGTFAPFSPREITTTSNPFQEMLDEKTQVCKVAILLSGRIDAHLHAHNEEQEAFYCAAQRHFAMIYDFAKHFNKNVEFFSHSTLCKDMEKEIENGKAK